MNLSQLRSSRVEGVFRDSSPSPQCVGVGKETRSGWNIIQSHKAFSPQEQPWPTSPVSHASSIFESSAGLLCPSHAGLCCPPNAGLWMSLPYRPQDVSLLQASMVPPMSMSLESACVVPGSVLLSTSTQWLVPPYPRPML